MSSAGLWLSRQGPCGLPAALAASSKQEAAPTRAARSRPHRHTPDTKPLYPLAPIRYIEGRIARRRRNRHRPRARPVASLPMFALFERLLKPTDTPERAEPPPGFIAFFWHFARQAKGLFAALFAAGFVVALLDSTIPVFMGRIVTLITATPPAELFEKFWPHLLGMALVLLIARPLALTAQNLIANQAISANVSNRIRWQNHWYVVRQSWAFFQNDFAGRIANRVMQTGPAIRETLVALLTSVWYILVYGTSAFILLASADPVLALPIALWFLGYLLMLRVLVPRMRDRSKEVSEGRSLLTGRIVDSHTNLFYRSLRLNTLFGFCLSALNALMVTSTGALALVLWTQGKVEVGTVAMALPLAWQIVNIAGWVAWQITSIFENVGVIQEGMMTIARPITLTDLPDAPTLKVTRGEIRFEDVRFGYGRESGVIDGLTLTVRPGEKIGLIGRSGAGKSTVVNLLLRFFDLEGGRIVIDGQDIAAVTQESLRAQISVVTQDTSLLHRSIRDNIRYGRPQATDAEIVTAAKLAHADEFIGELEDWKQRRGYAAQVGERGVKLSGGQRQRIAIARVILKDAPILVLDEATSALDSEVEAAIQSSLGTLMAGKTVIAIAHRLSTIARMDRLVVLDRGRIAEQGTHDELLRRNGHYAALWQRQSGGFIDAGDMQAAG